MGEQTPAELAAEALTPAGGRERVADIDLGHGGDVVQAGEADEILGVALENRVVAEAVRSPVLVDLADALRRLRLARVGPGNQ